MFRRCDGPDRGQLLVIIGLLLGMVFVFLAVTVNAAVFAENLSTRETVDSERTASYTAGIEPAIAGHATMTNGNGSRTAAEARRTFNGTLDAWTERRVETAATEGALYETEWTTHLGWRLERTTDGDFAPADNGSATDWTVAGDARNVSTFELNVTRADLFDGTAGVSDIENNAFHVNVSDGATDWELYVFRDTGNGTIVVHQGDPSTFGDLGALLDDSDSCSRATSRAVIDLRNATFAGSACSALEPNPSLSGDLSVRYENVQDATDAHVKGTYTIVVNGSDAIATNGTDHPDRFNVSGKQPPTATAEVYAVDYEARYEREDVVHERSGRHLVREETY